ncbi:hypothetical protein ACTXT7_002890 [Hymenolepis weldensis]
MEKRSAQLVSGQIQPLASMENQYLDALFESRLTAQSILFGTRRKLMSQIIPDEILRDFTAPIYITCRADSINGSRIPQLGREEPSHRSKVINFYSVFLLLIGGD